MSLVTVTLISISAFLDLYPAPQSAYIQEKKLFALEDGLPVVVPDNATKADLAPVELLFEAMGRRLKLAPASGFDIGQKALYVGEVRQNRAFQHRSLRRFAPDASHTVSGGYHLYIQRNGIVLAGIDAAGLNHGMQTLIQIVEASRKNNLNLRGIPAVPYVEIRDFPTVPFRAVLVRSPLTKEQLKAYAALKCNVLIFEHDDFYDLSGEKTALWRQVFEEARAFGIAPAPMFQMLKVPQSFLRLQPKAVEGRSRIDRLTLPEDDWVSLSKRNIICTPENPVRITLGKLPLRPRQDYSLQEGSLEPPFDVEFVHPWLVRRMPGGKVQDRDAIAVTYSYAPPESDALCPNAPETRILVRDALEKIVHGLNPAYLHGGFGEISRLNQDLRCRDLNKSHAETLLAAGALLTGIMADLQCSVPVLLWADPFLPPSPNAVIDSETSLHSAAEVLPGNIILIPRFSSDAIHEEAGVAAALDWMAERERPVIAALDAGAPDAAYRLAGAIAERAGKAGGLVALDADPRNPAVRAALGRAWSTKSVRLLWPEMLNPFFDSSLWNPTFEEVKETLLHYIENRILSGIPPEQIRTEYNRFVSAQRTPWPKDDEGLRMTTALLEQLTRYLEIEYAYATGKEKSALRDLGQLVRRYAEADITLDPERVTRILETLEQQQLFVPASILIGRPLCYYRPQTKPAEMRVYEAQTQIDYVDEKGRAQATVDLLAHCGAVFRIDLETLNARSIQLMAGRDGRQFESVPARVATANGFLRGPLLPVSPVNARYLRIAVESDGDQAVLREVRIFVYKAPPRAACPLLKENEAAQGAWPESVRMTGMLLADKTRLAAAPTEIRLARNSDYLLVGILAQDPMAHAMGAEMTRYDSPLWQEESVEIRIMPKGRMPRRFLVNPLGAQHDSMAVAGNLEQWDAGWDADWRVKADRTDTGWTATLMLPFAVLGGAPQTGESWHFNAVRYRNNVEKEISYWAVAPDNAPMCYGTVVFE